MAATTAVLASLLLVIHVDALNWAKVPAGGGVEAPARRDAAFGYDSRRHRLASFGGRAIDDGTILGDTWVLDISQQLWMRVGEAGNSPSPRFSMVYGVAQSGHWDALVVGMGEGRDRVFFNDVWALNLTTLNWVRLWSSASPGISSPAPAPRYGASGGIDLSRPQWFVVTHGFSSRRFDDTFALWLGGGVANVHWKELSPSASAHGAARPFARCLHAGTVLPAVPYGGGDDDGGASMFLEVALFAGCGSGGHGPCPAHDAWLLRVHAAEAQAGSSTGLWSSLPTCPGPTLWAAMVPAPWSRREVVVFGGNGGLLFGSPSPGEVAVLNVDTGRWLVTRAPAAQGTDLPQPTAGISGAAGRSSPHVNATIDAAYFLLGSAVWRLAGSPRDHVPPLPTLQCSSPVDLRTMHGVLMALSWGVLLPLGVTVARFFRHIGPMWFTLHRALQTAGVLLQLAGVVVALLMVQAAKFSAVPHALIGILVTLIGLQQPINAHFRPHPPENRSARRIWWERIHKNAGRCACLLGVLNPFWGLAHLGAGSFAIVMYSVWLGGLIAFWVVASVRRSWLPFTKSARPVPAGKTSVQLPSTGHSQPS